MSLEGDERLSGWDNQLWGMVYHILLKFKTPVQFKEYRGDAYCRQDSLLQWFVPEGPSFEAIEHFILDELKRNIKKGKLIDDKFYAIGLNVQILKYSGIQQYLENKYLEPLIKNLTDKFLNDIKKEKDGSGTNKSK